MDRKYVYKTEYVHVAYFLDLWENVKAVTSRVALANRMWIQNMYFMTKKFKLLQVPNNDVTNSI